MTLDISKIQSSSLLGSFQNSAISTITFSVPAFTFASGNEQLLTYLLPVANQEDVSQVKANFSIDSTKWYILPIQRFGVLKPSAKTDLAAFPNYDGSNLIITLRITPTGISPWSYSAFTFTVNAKTFITPN